MVELPPLRPALLPPRALRTASRGALAAGATLQLTLTGGAQLAKQRGLHHTLLDTRGLKSDGVSNTGGQVQREGCTIVF